MGKSVGEYVSYLESKGFSFGEDAIGFIFFGKQYTNAEDTLVNAAIEVTLKAQKKFDGSFYISLLESMKKSNISTHSDAVAFSRERGLI
ncbi:hypothetical protein D0469_19240 [Peribacillus saganii]|uniref:Uncharacterized protein n=1 Tax=Peribacillus saganii TaxID=2303992 RepID=A0A372LDM0_9BACI|nr:DUF6123 family protein [Peribacillus saganii]RFU64076.1 hypothetical protein D0469_19240 [Peribacillus saganii]